MSDGDPSVKQAASPRGPRGIRTNHAELKRRRITARLTLSELAGEAGCTKSNLSQIENERYNAGIHLLGRLAAALGCDITDLTASDNGNGDTT